MVVKRKPIWREYDSRKNKNKNIVPGEKDQKSYTQLSHELIMKI